MTPEKALRVYAYIRKYGKKWTADQVAKFYIEVARLSYPRRAAE